MILIDKLLKELTSLPKEANYFGAIDKAKVYVKQLKQSPQNSEK